MTSRTLRSKSSITIAGREPIREYIPYNPNWKEFADAFRSAIEESELEWDKLAAPKNGRYAKEHFETLKEIYDRLKTKNRHSLVVYSNVVPPAATECFLSTVSLSRSYGVYVCDPYGMTVPAGCMYFGDATVESRWLDPLHQFLGGTNRLSSIGIMQIPHHGSYHSKGQDVVQPYYDVWQPVHCVVSVGETNKYGHPSVCVIKELMRRGGIVLLVTEAVSSLLVYQGGLPRGV